MERLIVRRMTAIMAAAFLVFALGTVVFKPAEVHAAANTATGDIGGTDADLDDSTAFNLTTATLGLSKVAFLTDGTALSDNDTLPKGTLVQFVIYIDNTTAFPVDDVSIQDVLAGTFVYQAGSMVIDNTLATGSTAAAIWSQLDTAGTAVTDAAGDDVASFDGTDTIDIGNANEATNAQLDAAASLVWAVRITVRMQ